MRRATAHLLTFPLRAGARSSEAHHLWVHHAVAAAKAGGGDAEQTGGVVAWAQSKALSAAERQLKHLADAPPDSLRGFAYKAVLMVLDRVSPDEVALRHLAAATDLVILKQGNKECAETPERTLARLQRLATERHAHHAHFARLSAFGASC
jgi:hypothetical protein